MTFQLVLKLKNFIYIANGHTGIIWCEMVAAVPVCINGYIVCNGVQRSDAFGALLCMKAAKNFDR